MSGQSLIRAIYVGREEELREQSALLELPPVRGWVKAQFDDLVLHQAYGWTRYRAKDFAVKLEEVLERDAIIAELRRTVEDCAPGSRSNY